MNPSTPRHTPAPGSRVPQKNPDLLGFEKLLVERVNGARSVHNLPPLRLDPLLAAVARAHSDEMRALNYFAHESPVAGREIMSERYQQAFGVQARYLAENLWRGYCRAWIGPTDAMERQVRQWIKQPFKVTRDDAEQMHRDLMASPGHRANMMLPTPTRVGMGLIQEGGDVWLTQLFAE